MVFALYDEIIQQSFEREVLAAWGALAGKLATNGLESGEELEPADANGALPCMLHTGMFPEQVKLIVQHGILIGEASHRWLRDADEHALFKWGAGVGQRWRILSWPIPSIRAKLRSKLARRAQLMVVLHDSGEQHVDVNHEFNVGTLLEGMEGA